MSNPHVVSNLITPMTVLEYENATNCVQQLLVYIFEECFTTFGLERYQKLKFGPISIQNWVNHLQTIL